MKYHVLFSVIATSIFLGGCTEKVTQAEYDAMESDYQSQISELEAQVTSQKEYIDATNTSIKELSSNVDDFEYQDWRTVVPTVYENTKTLESNIQEFDQY
ncbi:hypothetical protein [uncultured Acinetobacter sp.]|uniref:hypothetical protein n=1 Tax=uncultured Acinetobacter sp. TaxID=165433 RepID=UPI00260F0D4B|nr:hypothetical protein [uncultured Acinetobacter sp.]